MFRKIVSLVSLPFKSLIDLAAPKLCEVCGEVSLPGNGNSAFLCDSCLAKVPYAASPGEIENAVMSNFKEDEFAISRLTALFTAEEDNRYMQLIYSLKYSGFMKLGAELGELLGKRLITDGFTGYDALIPIPVHHARRRERGFNQSEIIALGVSKITGDAMRTDLVARKRYTQTQTRLGSPDRKVNVADAFVEGKNGSDIKGGKFLLIDDVLTTGSTMNACAETLLQAGAGQVDAAAVAVPK